MVSTATNGQPLLAVNNLDVVARRPDGDLRVLSNISFDLAVGEVNGGKTGA